MAKKDFIPDSDAALLQWLGILKTQSATQPTSVLSAAQITALTASIDHLTGKIQAADATESAYRAAVQSKNVAKKSRPCRYSRLCTNFQTLTRLYACDR